ncbi:MAG: signal peptidase I [Candidatus Aenigmatarchaeota archaeon]
MVTVAWLDEFRRNHRMLDTALAILVIVAVAWLFYNGLAIALGTPMPMVSVVSGSMEPNLHVGDLMIISKGHYDVGDIAIYLHNGVTIIHRIVEVREDGMYIFKGDHNPAPDPEPVPPERILGEARLALPLLGYPRLALYAIGI